MKMGPIEAAGRESVRPYLLAWLVACAILTFANLGSIRALAFPDPDDTLRLLQVRDWLAGQSWHDVRQYRMNAPEGAPMHWSRLVDLPIAAVILLLRPFVGNAAAELGALVAVPLLTLGVVMALVATVTRRLLDRDHAIMAAFVVPISVVVTHQLRPMRIDHHGWQMALALAALLAALDPHRRRSGLIGGALAAVWLSISLEGLPFATALVALAAIRWLVDPREASRLVVTMASLAGTSLLLFAATKGAGGWIVNHCDAVSPAHLAVLALGAAGCALIARAGAFALPWKLGLFGVLGAAALALMTSLAPHCAAGPFEALDPLVYDFWYLRIKEGLPLWRAGAYFALLTITFPLIGLAGSWRQFRAAQGELRTAWAVTLFLLVAATLTALFVQRAGSVANLFAIPGGVALFKAALARAREIDSLPLKLVATFATLGIVAPGHAITAGTLLVTDKAKLERLRSAQRCLTRGDLQALGRLPTSDIAAPIDIGPSIIVHTKHRIIASGHHRNAAAMHDAISIFIARPEAARALLTKRSIDYVVVCPDLPETSLYEQYGPDGLWAELRRGRTPAWLEPVRLPGVERLLVWRVKPQG